MEAPERQRGNREGAFAWQQQSRCGRVSRTGDPNLDAFADAVVLFSMGEVPDLASVS
jgi:hypothetical protein